MFCAVEDEDGAHDCLRGDQVGLLRHVPRAVDLARVRDRLHNFDFGVARAVGAELAALVIVLLGGDLG